MIKKTKEMIERENRTGNKFCIDRYGYGILKGYFFAEVIYISLPNGHPCINKDYLDEEVDVNGGLTFGKGNVFGWDYGHYKNIYNFKKDIKNAIDYFKSKENEK